MTGARPTRRAACAGPSVPPPRGRDGLLAHEMPDVLADLDEFRPVEDLVAAGPVEPDLDDVLDPAGARAHDRDPVGQEYGLVHVVRDEDHGLAAALPDGA